MNTQDLSLFVHTADSGSISRAAEKLDMTSAAASAALKRLEKQLEITLFIRSTRQLRITVEGERFLVYCREALSNLAAGKASVQALAGKVAGELRISAPSDIGRNLLIPWMDEIMEQHPDLSINVLLGDSLADFYMDRVDLAVRYGNQNDSSMVVFKLALIRRILCASPHYIAAFGMPQSLDELARHNCLLFQRNSRTDDLWEFVVSNNDNAERIKLKVSGNRSANDSDVVRRWNIAGKGISYKSQIDVLHDLKSGRLVQILPEYHSAPIELSLVCPSRKQITPAVLLLRDMLRVKFAQLLGV